jgi:crotonobetainyl-CoA:carnitine CoA-transferase CaiB-like acyl-CoA transferase
LSCIGVLASLLWRDRSGKGQYIDLSMTDGVAYLLGHVYSDYFRTGQIPRRGEAPSSGGLPQYSVYETADGKFISIAALEPKFLENLCNLVGRPDFIGNLRDGAGREEMRTFLKETFRLKTRDEWFETLTAAEVPTGKVYSVDEAVDDPQLLSREMFVDVADNLLGGIRQVGMALKMSETPSSIRSLGQRKGAQTLEILRSLNYTTDEINAMKRSKAILVAEDG